MTLQTPVAERPATPDLAVADDGYAALLKNRNFVALWLGQIFSQLGDRVVFVVFIAMIVHYFGTSDSYNSYLYVAFTIPAILLTAVAGVFVDRWPRRAVLVTTNVLRAGFIAMLPWAAARSMTLFPLYMMAFLVSCATQFFVPAEAATIPTIVDKRHLLQANSLFLTTMMASLIFGFALGDPLINIFSLKQVHWAIVGLFLMASAALCFVKVPPSSVARSSSATLGEAWTRFFAEIREGADYIRSHPMVLAAMLKLAVLFTTVVSVCFLFINFAKVYLYDNALVAASKFSYIVAFSGIGMAVGSVCIGKFLQRNRQSTMVYGGFVVTGLCLALLTMVSWMPKHENVLNFPPTTSLFVYLDRFTLTTRMVYTYTLAMIMGVAGSLVAVPLQALLHELIPEDKRGKVLGVQFTLLSTASTLPVVVAGLAVEYTGVNTMFLLIGIPLLLLGLGGFITRGQPVPIPLQQSADTQQDGPSHVAPANW